MNANWINRPPSSNVTTLPPGADAQLTLAVEPDSKEEVILTAIQAAKRSIWSEMYQFNDQVVGRALLQAASGLDVQLLYESFAGKVQPAGLLPPGQQTLPAWARPNPAIGANGNAIIHHAKFMIIDAGIAGQQKAYIMTANFTEDALGVGLRNNREYIICDTNPQDISLLMAIFSADRQSQLFQPPMTSNLITAAPNLIVSPANAHQQMRALLDSAKQSILIQSEVINDPNTGSPAAQALSIEGALVNAIARGVKDVRMILPPQGTGDPSIPDSSAAITNLQHTPAIQIKTNAQLFMHAKLVIVDQHLAYVGSHNLDRASLKYNREVGIIISNNAIIKTLLSTFETDWQGAS